MPLERGAQEVACVDRRPACPPSTGPWQNSWKEKEDARRKEGFRKLACGAGALQANDQSMSTISGDITGGPLTCSLVQGETGAL